ncbi:ribbon-helix-helix domain-containing protein [Ralstonia pseudosolanacearum]|uniref:ribbon-helix-helix domain-containing protein n=1 Tax=Ralstonia pseudosolanacearum TaxID=1310165 RepID=UPI00090A2DA2|nr:hypothetical protein [Ralstonia pseudosolanacearum]QKL92060.1 hypothetical protein HI802_08030 [Ralstonia solanacearum]QKL97135.1 hypothetical protein HI801_08030 [Ralstonia solanacearum]QLR10233.1 hypothetical protein H1A20_07975 [Ralstonia solanacearum]TXD86129.1 hypothetical protein FUT89_16105 [Ralstonia pseudosolanacearum]
MTSDNAPQERCQNGARSRVLVNMSPEELVDLKARALAEGRTLSNMARHLIVRAMAADRSNRIPRAS